MKNSPRGRTSPPQPCLNLHSSPRPEQKTGACVRHTTGHIGAVDRKVGFRRGPKPHHRPIHPTNRAKKPMTQYLHRPLPLALTLDWRARGRRRRRRRWEHPHQTSQGDFRTELAVIASRRQPERTSDVNVGKQGNIAPTAGATGASMSRFCAQRRKIIIWTGGRR